MRYAKPEVNKLGCAIASICNSNEIKDYIAVVDAAFGHTIPAYQADE